MARIWLSATLFTAGEYGPTTVLRASDDNFFVIVSASLAAILSALSSNMSLMLNSIILEYGGKPKSFLSDSRVLLKSVAMFCAML